MKDPWEVGYSAWLVEEDQTTRYPLRATPFTIVDIFLQNTYARWRTIIAKLLYCYIANNLTMNEVAKGERVTMKQSYLPI